jgi:methionine aminopeptidase
MKECFLCGRNGNGDRLERHHIFGGSRRKLSEKYGLVVDLCGDRCHRNGRYSVHKNAEVQKYLHEYGQKKAMEENVWTVREFINVFGKNYIGGQHE